MHGAYYYTYNLDEVSISNNDGSNKSIPIDSTNSDSKKIYRNESFNGKYYGYITSTIIDPSNEVDPELGQQKQLDDKEPVIPQKKIKSGWIRGYGPLEKELEEHNLKWKLICCGVPKDSLNTLPKQLLLMFGTDYCELCSENLVKSNTARLHYISRGHVRNQKRWLARNIDAILHDSKMPLKPRDLYCELCDIQITSKQLAESHYGGKVHRSIVEGRRDPKNIALLHPSMEQRLEQLIEREVKCLEAGNSFGVPPAPAPASALAKEPRDGPEEFTCHICKTVVTCSEQMTLHLNGKKHLNKEKQHIFRVMRGEDTDTGDRKTNNDEFSEWYSKDGTNNNEIDDE